GGRPGAGCRGGTAAGAAPTAIARSGAPRCPARRRRRDRRSGAPAATGRMARAPSAAPRRTRRRSRGEAEGNGGAARFSKHILRLEIAPFLHFSVTCSVPGNAVKVNRQIETAVLIVGAGPVGLTLALDLAWRGIHVTVVELRHAGEPPSVKCNQVSARSMEIFRRLGLAATIRAAGLPAEYRCDVSCCVSATGRELSRIMLPSRAGRVRGEAGDDGWWPTPEPPHRINQLFLEPLLFAHAAAQPRIRIL